LDELFGSRNIKIGTQKLGDLNYDPIVDLNKKNKFLRLIYYVLFDRQTLKRRIGEITYKLRKKVK